MGNEISCLSPGTEVVATTGGHGFNTLRNMVDDIKKDGSAVLPPRIMRWARRTIDRRVRAAAIKGLNETCIRRDACVGWLPWELDLRFQALVVLRDELEDSGFTVKVKADGRECNSYDSVTIGWPKRHHD